MNEEIIDINGLKLSVSTIGKSNLPTILILHGWLDQSASWYQVAKALSSTYRIIIPDHRGHGRSEHAPLSSHYHFPDYVSDVHQLIRFFKLQHFSLIGHSMGGTIAALTASMCIPPPSKLILIDGLGPLSEEPQAARRRYQQHLLQRSQSCDHSLMASMTVASDKIRRQHPFLSEKISMTLAKRITRPVQGGVHWIWDPRHRHKSAVGFNLNRHLSILNSISNQCHLIMGEDSWYKRIPDLNQRIAAFERPPIQHDIPGGHSPHLQCPQNLAQLLLSILQIS